MDTGRTPRRPDVDEQGPSRGPGDLAAHVVGRKSSTAMPEDMAIGIACDHAGFELKSELADRLEVPLVGQVPLQLHRGLQRVREGGGAPEQRRQEGSPGRDGPGRAAPRRR